MKVKIFNALKQAYSGLGLGDEVLQGQADTLAAMGFVTEENLATVVQGQKTFLESVQKMTDTRVTNAIKKAAPAPTPKPDTDPTPKADTLTPELVSKIVAESIKPFTDQLSSFQQQTAQERRNMEIAAKAKEYGIPDSFVSRFSIANDANLDDYFKGVKQEFVNIGFQGTNPPEVGGAASNDDIAELIDKGTKELNDLKK